MKKHYLLPFLLIMGYGISAQVGINTETPKSTLDVQASTDPTVPDGIIPPRLTGNQLLAKEAAYNSAQNGAIVFVTEPRTITTGAVKTLGVTTAGTYIYDANTLNSLSLPGIWTQMGSLTPSGTGDAAYALKASGNLGLLTLGLNLLGSSVNYFPLTNTSNATSTAEIPSTQVVTTGTQPGYYLVPSDGIYQINYSFRTGQGISAELLSGAKPGVIITKTVGGVSTGTTTTLDYRMFGSVNILDLSSVPLLNLVVASVTLTQGQINHIYNLQAGDILRFGIVQGGLNLGLLTDKSAELSIYKIK